MVFTYKQTILDTENTMDFGLTAEINQSKDLSRFTWTDFSIKE